MIEQPFDAKKWAEETYRANVSFWRTFNQGGMDDKVADMIPDCTIEEILAASSALCQVIRDDSPRA